MPLRRIAVAAVASLLFVGCTGPSMVTPTPEDTVGPATTSPSPSVSTPTPTSPSSASPTVSSTASTVPTEGALASSGEPSGQPLVFTAVRVAGHPGFDRVVVEFKGTGTPGWTTEYVKTAVLEGSGDKVTVKGNSILQVVTHFNTWPDDDYYAGPSRIQPKGTATIAEVFVAGSFEGYTQFFVGISGKPLKHRVTTMTNPSRLVIDVLTG